MDDRCARGTRDFDIKRTHAELEGASYRLFTTSYFDAQIVMRKNTLAAQRWLSAAAGVALNEVEAGVRLTTDVAPKTFQELSEELRCTIPAARVAALRLWKQRKVRLAMDEVLVGHPNFVVRGLAS
jgi:hypothetical protein